MKNAKKIATKVVSMLVAVLMVATMFPVVSFASETKNTSGYVYISVSYDNKYKNDQYGRPMAYIPVSFDALAAIDLNEYGLSEYLYDEDGDGTYENTEAFFRINDAKIALLGSIIPAVIVAIIVAVNCGKIDAAVVDDGAVLKVTVPLMALVISYLCSLIGVIAWFYPHTRLCDKRALIVTGITHVAGYFISLLFLGKHSSILLCTFDRMAKMQMEEDGKTFNIFSWILFVIMFAVLITCSIVNEKHYDKLNKVYREMTGQNKKRLRAKRRFGD
jgi:hypothetical protein